LQAAAAPISAAFTAALLRAAAAAAGGDRRGRGKPVTHCDKVPTRCRGRQATRSSKSTRAAGNHCRLP
jgi:hypothetical protein